MAVNPCRTPFRATTMPWLAHSTIRVEAGRDPWYAGQRIKYKLEPLQDIVDLDGTTYWIPCGATAF
jgi:hypothetical protein